MGNFTIDKINFEITSANVDIFILRRIDIDEIRYRKASNIRRTQSQNSNASRVVLQFS